MTTETTIANTKNGHAGSAEYTAEDITVMEGLEAVRKRPGMYIGTTGPEGVFHLVREIVDNSVDEAMAGFATTVDIHIHADGSVTVTDDGRGIPVDTHDKTGKSALETVMTTLHAGGKFGGKGYQVSGGLHGVGASVVNALSEWTVVEVRRDGYVYSQRFERGITMNEMSRRPQTSSDLQGDGTKVTWLPDSDVFPEVEYDWDGVAGRLREMAYLNQGLAIRLRSDWHEETHWPHNDVTFRFDGGVRSFVRTFNRRRGGIHDSVIYAAGTVEDVAVEVAFQYNQSFIENCLSFANVIRTGDEVPRPEPGAAGDLEHATARTRRGQRGLDARDLLEPRRALLLARVVPPAAEEPLVVLRRARAVVGDLLVEDLPLAGPRAHGSRPQGASGSRSSSSPRAPRASASRSNPWLMSSPDSIGWPSR